MSPGRWGLQWETLVPGWNQKVWGTTLIPFLLQKYKGLASEFQLVERSSRLMAECFGLNQTTVKERQCSLPCHRSARANPAPRYPLLKVDIRNSSPQDRAIAGNIRKEPQRPLQ